MKPNDSMKTPDGAGHMLLAVCGAHMRDMPLSGEMAACDATFVAEATTAPIYRLYALEAPAPIRPGLVRTGGDGAAIDLEVWSIPHAGIGRLLGRVSQPLGIGTVTLSDGRSVKGFLCEGIAVRTARDITSHGGWRAFMAHGSSSVQTGGIDHVGS